MALATTDRDLVTEISIVTRREAQGLRISVSGELDIATGPYLHSAINPMLHLLAREGISVALDVSAITFIDASGFRAIDSIRSSVEALDLEFRLAEASPPVRRFLALIDQAELIQSLSEESFAGVTNRRAETVGIGGLGSRSDRVRVRAARPPSLRPKIGFPRNQSS